MNRCSQLDKIVHERCISTIARNLLNSEVIDQTSRLQNQIFGYFVIAKYDHAADSFMAS